MLPGAPISFSGVPGVPVAPLAPYRALWRGQSHTAPCRVPHSTALQPMAGMPWSSQPTPYASAFIAPPAWPMYMPSCMPRPLTQPTFMQAQFEELARQHQDLEALELEVKRMSRTLNRNAVRNARVRSATSVRGSKRTCGQEQAIECASSQLASQRSQNPSGAPPLSIKVISMGVSSTVAPPYWEL